MTTMSRLQASILLAVAATIGAPRVALAEVILQELNPQDPPDVIRMNHDYNLQLLSKELERVLSGIEAGRMAARGTCTDTACRSEADRHAAEQAALERQRFGNEVERENLNFARATKSSQERLQAEDETRKRELEEQAKRHEEEMQKLDRKRADERRASIQRHAGEGTGIDAILAAGDQAVSRQEGAAPEDLSRRFKPRRRLYPLRAWTDGASSSETAGDSPPSSSVEPSKKEEGKEVTAPDPASPERRLVAEIERLEALQRIEPSPEHENRLAKLRAALEARRRERAEVIAGNEGENP